MKHWIGVFLALAVAFQVTAQEYRTTEHFAKKINTFEPKKTSNVYNARIEPKSEAPYPSGKDYRSYLMKVKTDYAKNHPAKFYEDDFASRADAPSIIQDFGTYFFPPNRDPILHTGGTPNDNSLAFANNGNLMVAWNSQIYAHDVQADTPIFRNGPFLTTLTFQDFAGNYTTDRPFDPKILYDAEEDKFILLFLSGRDTANSKTIIGFSTTNNPSDKWNVYEIDGNPLKNNTWTDYPQVALTSNELFYTVNLLKAGESWIAGFDQTIVWQIDKHSGFDGDSTLSLKLWDNITYAGKPLRYFRPIKNGSGPTGSNMYFISNRGVPVEWNDTSIVKNDSIFLLEITNEMNASPQLTVKAMKANDTYQTPTNATQADGHIFFTNDSRVLGGFYNNNEIQFVGNTMDKTTNRPAVYHGIIRNVSSTPTVSLKTIGHGSLDYGFPNIAYTGISTVNQSSVIGFNHTSATDFAGYSCVYYDGSGTYSAPKILKEGDNYVDGIPWSNGDRTYERWGDYFGIQRNFRAPKQVWLSGYFGQSTKQPASWITHVKAPFDANDPDDGIDTSYYPLNTNESTISTESRVYPNPSNGEINVEFSSSKNQVVTVKLISMNGNEPIKLLEGQIFAGINELKFEGNSFSPGIYVLTISAQDEAIYKQKLIIE